MIIRCDTMWVETLYLVGVRPGETLPAPNRRERRWTEYALTRPTTADIYVMPDRWGPLRAAARACAARPNLTSGPDGKWDSRTDVAVLTGQLSDLDNPSEEDSTVHT